MARRRQVGGEKIIEADNGFGWSRRRGSPALSVQSGVWVTEIFGITYRLVKFANPEGWCLYLGDRPNRHFYGEHCGRTLPSAIDKASEMIAKADLRGEGYEKETGA